MLKIITISCVIVAISLNFPNVKGFNPLPPNLLPYIIPRQPSFNPPINSDPLKINPPVDSDIPNLKSDASNLGIENILKEYLKKVQTDNASCIKLFLKGRETIIQLSSAFNSCLRNRNETLSVNTNIKRLSDLASNVQKGLTKDVDDTLQYLQKPLNLTSFLNIINRGLADVDGLLGIAISEILTVYPFNLIPLLPDVIRCYENLSHQFNLEYFCGLLADTGHCIQSIMQIFT
ncbi:uncharacterized protein LOC126858793 isoform X2 [Cataglyphis hispanica]|uniref:uncharacterized protein LOC126858793 isoform X2 n=1 Tax=Cataglyphis hispanica TaxID=1086592 RepID=UPI00217FAFCE|nr:uncharacterized protein LOC126858793 isoform X2 [Cataglyphis hispanica]